MPAKIMFEHKMSRLVIFVQSCQFSKFAFFFKGFDVIDAKANISLTITNQNERISWYPYYLKKKTYDLQDILSV
jgi:hypothetical protein